MAVAVENHHHCGSIKHPSKSRRCRFTSFPYPDFLDFSSFSPPLIQRSRSTPCFPTSSTKEEPIARVKIVCGSTDAGVLDLVVEAAEAMAFGARLVPASSGLGRAYFLRSPTGECLAIIKPAEDKPLTFFDIGRLAYHHCLRAGDTCVREAAAYILDHAKFAGVPPTALIRLSRPACAGASTSLVASIQRFIPHDFDAGDLGPSRFSVSSVHRIGILDVRLLNTDRHAGNLLVEKQNTAKNYREEIVKLVPIDHGLCLPEILDDPYFEWLHWPQATMPFSDLEIEYVSKLNPFKDAELLRAEFPSLRLPAIRILILCTIFLKRAVDTGLCLADIGGMMTREFCRLEGSASVLEELCWKTEEAMKVDNHLSEIDGGYIGVECEQKEFQFAIDCNEGETVATDAEDLVGIPLLLRSKRKKSLDIMQEEDGQNEREEESVGVRMVMKSVSFSAGELNSDGHGIQRRKVMSFMNMNEEEWKLFLDRFEQLLPEAFEVRKSMELKQRLGSSCNF